MVNDSVVVHVNRRRLVIEAASVTGVQLLELAGFEGNGWDLLQLQGEGDPTGGELILAATPLELKNGDHFRVIPGDRTFGGR